VDLASGRYQLSTRAAVRPSRTEKLASHECAYASAVTSMVLPSRLGRRIGVGGDGRLDLFDEQPASPRPERVGDAVTPWHRVMDRIRAAQRHVGTRLSTPPQR
jgi:hypothetical protein